MFAFLSLPFERMVEVGAGHGCINGGLVVPMTTNHCVLHMASPETSSAVNTSDFTAMFTPLDCRCIAGHRVLRYGAQGDVHPHIHLRNYPYALGHGPKLTHSRRRLWLGFCTA